MIRETKVGADPTICVRKYIEEDGPTLVGVGLSMGSDVTFKTDDGEVIDPKLLKKKKKQNKQEDETSLDFLKGVE